MDFGMITLFFIACPFFKKTTPKRQKKRVYHFPKKVQNNLFVTNYYSINVHSTEFLSLTITDTSSQRHASFKLFFQHKIIH